MPVRDLSDRTRVTRLGKIRLGEKTKHAEGVEYPVARPYFVLPDELKSVYGEQPTEIKIVFLSDDEEQIASQWYRAYNASHGRICIGDGYRADALLDADELEKRGGDLTPDRDIWAHGRTRGRTATKNVVRHEIACAGAGYGGQAPCPMYAQKDCSIRMFMQVAVVGAPGLGVYQIDTGSVISIQNVNGAIRMVKSLTNGRIAGIPLVLKRVKTEVSPPPDMKKKTIWTVALEVDPAMNAGRLLAAASAAPILALMPAPDDSDLSDQFNEENPTSSESEAPPEPTASGSRAVAPDGRNEMGFRQDGNVDKVAPRLKTPRPPGKGWVHAFGTVRVNEFGTVAQGQSAGEYDLPNGDGKPADAGSSPPGPPMRALSWANGLSRNGRMSTPPASPPTHGNMQVGDAESSQPAAQGGMGTPPASPPPHEATQRQTGVLVTGTADSPSADASVAAPSPDNPWDLVRTTLTNMKATWLARDFRDIYKGIVIDYPDALVGKTWEVNKLTRDDARAVYSRVARFAEEAAAAQAQLTLQERV